MQVRLRWFASNEVPGEKFLSDRQPFCMRGATAYAGVCAEDFRCAVIVEIIGSSEYEMRFDSSIFDD